MIKTEFGKTLRSERLAREMTQEGLAQQADVAYRFVQDLEAGNKQPTLTTVFKLAVALKMSPDQLIMPVWVEYLALGEGSVVEQTIKKR